MHNPYHSLNRSARCRGFSIIELMVAMVITLILLAGIGQIFLSSKKSFTIQDTLGRMQENGRYAIEVVMQDIRRAGFWGGNSDVSEITGSQSVTTEDGTCSDAAWARALSHRIFGKDDVRTGYGCLPSGAVARGDVLIMRYAAPWEVGGMTTPTFDDNMIYIRSSLFEGRMFLGDEESTYPIDAPAVRTAELRAHGYFIHAPNTTPTNNCPGSGSVPSLYRISLTDNGGPDPELIAEEIAYGVDNFQVQYGLDTDDDDSVDQFVDAMDPTDVRWDQVIAARVWILVRAECPETGYTNTNTYVMGDQNYTVNDGYRRHLYTSTARLRNR